MTESWFEEPKCSRIIKWNSQIIYCHSHRLKMSQSKWNRPKIKTIFWHQTIYYIMSCWEQFFSCVSKLDNRLYRKYTSTVWIQTNSEHCLLQLSCGQQCNIGHGVCESFFTFLFRVFRKIDHTFLWLCTHAHPRPNYWIYFCTVERLTFRCLLHVLLSFFFFFSGWHIVAVMLHPYRTLAFAFNRIVLYFQLSQSCLVWHRRSTSEVVSGALNFIETLQSCGMQWTSKWILMIYSTSANHLLGKMCLVELWLVAPEKWRPPRKSNRAEYFPVQPTILTNM